MALYGVNTHVCELFLLNLCKYKSSVFITKSVRDHVTARNTNLFAFHYGTSNFLGKTATSYNLDISNTQKVINVMNTSGTIFKNKAHNSSIE